MTSYEVSKPRNNCSNQPPYGTAEWRAWQQQREAEEVAARPITNRPRRPMSPEELNRYRPKSSTQQKKA